MTEGIIKFIYSLIGQMQRKMFKPLDITDDRLSIKPEALQSDRGSINAVYFRLLVKIKICIEVGIYPNCRNDCDHFNWVSVSPYRPNFECINSSSATQGKLNDIQVTYEYISSTSSFSSRESICERILDVVTYLRNQNNVIFQSTSAAHSDFI